MTDNATVAGGLVIQVVRGQPDPEELAAVMLVLLAAARARGAEGRSRDSSHALSWPAAARRYCPPGSWQASQAAITHPAGRR